MNKQTRPCKHMLFEEAKDKLHERYSCLESIRATEHVAVLPRCIGSSKDIKSGIKAVLDAELNIFSLRYNGVPVAYGNMYCLDSMGRVHANKPLIHFNVSLDIIIFRPKIGAYVSGIVNKISSDHLGVLIHNIFNASILKPRDQVSELSQKIFKEGQEVIFEVTGMHCYNSLLVIEGELIDTSRLPEMVKGYGKRSSLTSKVSDNVGIKDFQQKTDMKTIKNSESSAFNNSVKELSEQPKFVHVVDETPLFKEDILKISNSVKNRKSEITAEEVGLLMACNSAKKKKRHLHAEDSSEQTVASACVDANLMEFELEKRKRNRHKLQCIEEEELDISAAVLKRKEKKKHKEEIMKRSIDSSVKVQE